MIQLVAHVNVCTERVENKLFDVVSCEVGERVCLYACMYAYEGLDGSM